MLKSKTIILVFLLFIVGCSFFSSKKTTKKSKNLNISFKESGWIKIPKDQSDMAYKNKSSNSIIIVNSNCKKYILNSLEKLTHSIMSSLSNIVIEKQEKLLISKRESLKTHATAKVDGVKTYLTILVLKKNRCIYDYLLIANSHKTRALDEESFNNLIKNSVIK